MVVDALAAARGRARGREEARRLGRRSAAGGEDAQLVKPLTFMNRSGSAVARAARPTRGAAPPTSWWSWTTSPSISGMLRVRERGSHGGHNGLRSLIDVLGTDEFARCGWGSARASCRRTWRDYVLSSSRRRTCWCVQEMVGLGGGRGRLPRRRKERSRP